MIDLQKRISKNSNLYESLKKEKDQTIKDLKFEIDELKKIIEKNVNNNQNKIQTTPESIPIVDIHLQQQQQQSYNQINVSNQESDIIKNTDNSKTNITHIEQNNLDLNNTKDDIIDVNNSKKHVGESTNNNIINIYQDDNIVKETDNINKSDSATTQFTIVTENLTTHISETNVKSKIQLENEICLNRYQNENADEINKLQKNQNEQEDDESDNFSIDFSQISNKTSKKRKELENTDESATESTIQKMKKRKHQSDSTKQLMQPITTSVNEKQIILTNSNSKNKITNISTLTFEEIFSSMLDFIKNVASFELQCIKKYGNINTNVEQFRNNELLDINSVFLQLKPEIILKYLKSLQNEKEDTLLISKDYLSFVRKKLKLPFDKLCNKLTTEYLNLKRKTQNTFPNFLSKEKENMHFIDKKTKHHNFIRPIAMFSILFLMHEQNNEIILENNKREKKIRLFDIDNEKLEKANQKIKEILKNKKYFEI